MPAEPRDSRTDLILRAERWGLTVSTTEPLAIVGCTVDGPALVLPVAIPLTDRRDIGRAIEACADELGRRETAGPAQLGMELAA